MSEQDAGVVLRRKIKTKPSKVAILGTADSWKDAPFRDKDWEIWVCNRAGLTQKPWDRLFEIHTHWDYESPEARGDYLDKLAKIKGPQQVISVVPIPGAEQTETKSGVATLVIDRDALFKKYGVVWFSSSFAFMIGHALELGVEEIGLWGIDMESREEYLTQFYGVLHFIGVAKALGIKVEIPERSALRREPLPYPDRFETAMARTYEETARRLWKQLDKAQDNVDHAREYAAFVKGRIYERDDYDEELSDDREKGESALKRHEAAFNRLKGELWATQHYKRLFVWNALPPEPGEEDSWDAENPGPI